MMQIRSMHCKSENLITGANNKVQVWNEKSKNSIMDFKSKHFYVYDICDISESLIGVCGVNENGVSLLDLRIDKLSSFIGIKKDAYSLCRYEEGMIYCCQYGGYLGKIGYLHN